ncbi:MAG TPA: TetR/AcrR family transcriptional regulator [Pyrinomonadaceae bacterium]|nr:TetR/AcrR family transcriptional regulator [Pyrinomonadaceae bacterium]
MSENDRLHLAALKKREDARVRRTRDALGDALVALMQEKPFDTITVQDVLDRAKVGRSTFYSHYSDKDDLLMSDAEEFFESVAMMLSVRGDTSDRVFPVREFFGHIIEAKTFVDALVSSGKMNDNMELARGLFARGIERRLAELPKGQGIPENDRPAIAFAHAGALIALLQWWVDRGMKQTPAEMDQLFHRMVWKGLES